MGAILPVYWLGLSDPKVGFMHDGGGLQGMLAVLAAHLACGYAMQLVVDQFHETVGGLLLAAPPPVEKSGDGVRFEVECVFVFHYSQL